MAAGRQGRWLRIGKIVGVHALGGEVRLLPDNPTETTLSAGADVELRRAGEVRKAKVESVRPHRRLLLLRLAGVNDRSAAEQHRGFEVWLEAEQLPALGPDEYYYYELEGMEVFTTGGERIGVVASVMATPAADVLVIRGADEREYLVPMVAQFVTSIDRHSRRVCIEPIPGLLEP